MQERPTLKVCGCSGSMRFSEFERSASDLAELWYCGFIRTAPYIGVNALFSREVSLKPNKATAADR